MAIATQDRRELELSHGLPSRASDAPGTVRFLPALRPSIVTKPLRCRYAQMRDLKIQLADVICQVARAQAAPGPKPRLEAKFCLTTRDS